MKTNCKKLNDRLIEVVADKHNFRGSNGATKPNTTQSLISRGVTWVMQTNGYFFFNFVKYSFSIVQTSEFFNFVIKF